MPCKHSRTHEIRRRRCSPSRIRIRFHTTSYNTHPIGYWINDISTVLHEQCMRRRHTHCDLWNLAAWRKRNETFGFVAFTIFTLIFIVNKFARLFPSRGRKKWYEKRIQDFSHCWFVDICALRSLFLWLRNFYFQFLDRKLHERTRRTAHVRTFYRWPNRWYCGWTLAFLSRLRVTILELPGTAWSWASKGKFRV